MTFNNAGVIIAGDPSNLSLVARNGTPVPGAPAGANFSVLYTPVLDETGDVAFYSGLSGTVSGGGLHVGHTGALQLVAMPGESWIINRIDRKITRRSRRCFVFIRDATLDVRTATQIEVQAGEYIEIDSDMGPRPRTPRVGDIVLGGCAKRPVPHPLRAAEYLGLPTIQVPNKTMKQKWQEAIRHTFEELKSGGG